MQTLLNSFRGHIKLYPSIVVDKFVGHFRYGFITHAHTDHLEGLDKCNSNPSDGYPKFFATKITQTVLRTQHKYATLKIHTLEINETMKLYLEDQIVNVTPLPANHIPGSCMYLFEGESGNVLHTGDFRLGLDELRETSLFKDGMLKPIEYLYLDKTFWGPKSYELPPAIKSKALIIETALDWLNASEENVVYLLLPYFGYVDILCELYNETEIQINVEESRSADKFKAVPYLSDKLTDDEDTKIFVKNKPSGADMEYELSEMCSEHVRMIMVSVQHFVATNNSCCAMEVRDEYNMYWINHSLHCSQKELEKFTAELKPRKTIP